MSDRTPAPRSQAPAEEAPRGFLYRICCCPWGADLLWTWLAVTVLLGVLVVAGNALLAVSTDLGFMDFVAGGQLAPKGGPPVIVQACDGLQDAGHRSRLVQACWTPAQTRSVPWLVALDSLWGLAYAPLLALLGIRLLAELIADRHGRRCGAHGALDAPDSPAQAWPWMLLLALPPAALLGADWVENWQAWRLAAAGVPAGDAAYAVMNIAAWVKLRLLSLAVGVVLVLFGLWLFGVLFSPGEPQAARRRDRALLRLALARVLWRSRYVLAMLGLFGALALGMDQSRDVLVGMAQGLARERVSGAAVTADQWLVPWVLGAIVVTILAVWMLAYASWLWSRIPARMRSPEVDMLRADEPLAADGTPAAEGSAAPSRMAGGGARAQDGRDTFAKWWARWLGLLPILILTALAGLASGDAMRVAAAGLAAGLGNVETAEATGLVLWDFALATVLLGFAVLAGFARDRGREATAPRPATAPGPCGGPGKHALYYNAVRLDESEDELAGYGYRFLILLRRAPLTLPVLALVLFQALRAMDLFLAGRVPVTVAVITLALTLWTCVLGLIAQAAQRQGMPWVLLLVVLAGVLSLLGVTDNHRVLTEPYAAVGAPVLWGMWAAQLVLSGLLVLALYWTWLRLTVRLQREEPRWFAWLVNRLAWLTQPLSRLGLVAREARGHRRHMAVDVGFFVLLVLLALPVLWVSDRLLAPGGVAWPVAPVAASSAASPAAPPAESTAAPGAETDGEPVEAQGDARRALDTAIGAFISSRLADAGGGPDDPVPVYFVSAEGGGIRAAYWTALMLERQAQADPSFAARTFSISGVSGGSIGAAVWTACRQQATPGCIHSVADASLLTPLLSAWLFDDVLGAFLPTSVDAGPVRWCRTPGCGMLGRGLWLERSLEAALPALRRPLVEVNAAPPHLFLNSTRVEDGSRAIASPIRIGAAAFPSAVDQLAVLGTGVPLSTAAHNSARFTYVNAIGSVQPPAKPGPAGAAVAAAEATATADSAREPAAVNRHHLADGGYFDNGGGQTTADIIRAFTRCLFGPIGRQAGAPSSGEIGPGEPGPTASDPCGLDQDLRAAAQRRLLPQGIQIRNGIAPTAEPGGQARTPAERSMPDCPPLQVPSPRRLDIYPDVLGPALTAFNAIGTGANGRVAEADVCRAVQAWRLLRARVSGVPVADEPDLVRRCDLVDGSVLFPLGWYLSPTAAAGMLAAADDAERMAALCLAGLQQDAPSAP